MWENSRHPEIIDKVNSFYFHCFLRSHEDSTLPNGKDLPLEVPLTSGMKYFRFSGFSTTLRCTLLTCIRWMSYFKRFDISEAPEIFDWGHLTLRFRWRGEKSWWKTSGKFPVMTNHRMAFSRQLSWNFVPRAFSSVGLFKPSDIRKKSAGMLRGL